MFIHYDLANGDTLTIVVSGGKVIGTSYGTKKSHAATRPER